MPEAFARAAEILLQGILDRAFPAASVEVGRADGPLWRRAFGTLTYEPDAPDTTDDTVFDLASLTKVIATTTLVMRAVDDGALTLDDPVRALAAGMERDGSCRRSRSATCSRTRPGCRRICRSSATTPAASSSSRRSATRRSSTRRERSRSTATSGSSCSGSSSRMPVPAHREPRAVSIRRRPWRRSSGGSRRSSRRAAHLQSAQAWRDHTAPTELDQWRGRLLVGEVHDENTWALGGAAGHAGLFGTAAAVGAFARASLRTIAGEPVLAQPATFREFIRRTGVPGSSRRSAGTRCFRRRRAARACRQPRSATPASPARRCGSTGSGISTSCC